MNQKAISKLINKRDFIELGNKLRHSSVHYSWNMAVNECLKQGLKDKAKNYINEILHNPDIFPLSQRPKAIAGVIGALIDANEWEYIKEITKKDCTNAKALKTKDAKHEVLKEIALVFAEKDKYKLSHSFPKTTASFIGKFGYVKYVKIY